MANSTPLVSHGFNYRWVSLLKDPFDSGSYQLDENLILSKLIFYKYDKDLYPNIFFLNFDILLVLLIFEITSFVFIKRKIFL